LENIDLLSPRTSPVGYSIMNAVYLVKCKVCNLYKNIVFCLYKVMVHAYNFIGKFKRRRRRKT
jgi:hypothetical protein